MSVILKELNLIIYTYGKGMNVNSFKSLFKSSLINMDNIHITLVGSENNYSTNLNLKKGKKYYFIANTIYSTEKDSLYVREISKIIGKENSFSIDYECCAHPSHFCKWKNDTFKYFSKVYNSYYKIIDNKKYKWIPGFLWILGYFPTKQSIEKYNQYCLSLNPNNTKVKFMVNNPINGSNSLRNYLTLSFLTESIKENEVFNFYGRETYISNYLKHFNLENYKYTPCSDELYNEKERDVLDQGLLCKKKIAIFTWYKFILTVENNPETYVSEKFIDCLYSNSVPVYFGQENMSKIFPDIFTNGVINGWDFLTKNEKDKLINIKLDTNNNKILSINSLKFNYRNMSINRIVKYLKNMSPKEYDLRLENIKKYRDKYFEIFHIGPVWNYCIHDFIINKKDLHLLNEEELKQYNLFKTINERIVLEKSKNRKAEGAIEKFIEEYVKK